MRKLGVVAAVLAAGVACAALQGEQAAKVDGDGFVRNWLILAPVPLAEGERGAEALGKEILQGEANLAPKAGDTAKRGDASFTWREYKSESWNVEFNKALGSDDTYCAGYAVTYVGSDAERNDVKVKMGSDDQAAVYVNGKKVVSFDGGDRPTEQDQNTGEGVTLKKGVNVVVFKVINNEGPWGAAVRFTDKDDKPLTDLTVRLQP